MRRLSCLPARRRRRCRSVSLSAVVTVLFCLSASPAVALFSATTSNGTIDLAADTLAAPSGLSLSSTCDSSSASAPTWRTNGLVEANTTSNNATSLTVNRPSGATAGDVIFAFVTIGDINTTVTPPTPPAGGTAWTEARTKILNSTIGVYMFSHVVASSGEPSSYTFGLTDVGASRVVAQLLTYSGVDTTTPVDGPGAAWTGQPSSTSPDITAPSITTTTAAVVLAWFGYATQSQTINTAPANVTQRTSLNNGNGDSTVIGYDFTTSTSTTTTDRHLRLNQNGARAIGVQIALRGTSATGAATVTANWTATTSTWASGYKFQRGSNTPATVTGQSTTTTTDSSVPNGTHTYSLRAYRNQWTSAAATGNITISC